MNRCVKGCKRGAIRSSAGTVLFLGPNHVGHDEQKTAVRVQISDALRKNFATMVQFTELKHAPVLEFYNGLHGVGGMFLADQWAILIGVQDQQQIARQLVSRWPEELKRIYAGANGGQIPTIAGLLIWTTNAAIRRCMAHELGHALIAAGYQNPYPLDEEAAADHYAGKLDAVRGMNPDLGRMFFHTIGCIGPACGHPEPMERAEAYQRGYDEQRLAA